MAASALALGLAFFATAFARASWNVYDLPTYIDLTEWPATLLFVAAAWAAWERRERTAAWLMVGALVAFFAAQSRFLFQVPMGFGVVGAGALAFLAVGAWFRNAPWYRQRIAIPASVLIALVGAWWFVERVFL